LECVIYPVCPFHLPPNEIPRGGDSSTMAADILLLFSLERKCKTPL
jgi:hypothetical protein